MNGAALACRPIPRELDGGGAGALIQSVLSIWQRSARSGSSPVPASWPWHARLPLTYQLVSDVA